MSDCAVNESGGDSTSLIPALKNHRHHIARRYFDGLWTSYFVQVPTVADGDEFTAEQYVVTVLRPDAMLENPFILAGNRMWNRPVVRHVGSNEPAEYLGVQEGQIALPIWPYMSVEAVDQVVELVRAALAQCRRDSDDRGYAT